MPKIVVTGGCGYIGSHTLVDLIQNGYDVVSIDNNSRSSEDMLQGVESITAKKIRNYQVDLCDLDKLINAFEDIGQVDGIIHFAAYKSVPESVADPLLYYRNNILSLISTLEVVRRFNISHYVFSSSCSVYGNVKELPVTELTPVGKIESPYGRTKLIGESMIEDFAGSSKSSFVLLRYFNPVGAHESGLIGEVPHGSPDNLVPIITQTAIGKRDKLYVHGGDYPTRDGSCVRDYIHVMDIAHAHTLAMRYLESGSKDNCQIINLGSGDGITVLEAVNTFKQISGVDLNFEIGPRRAGDVAAIYSDSSKARELLDWGPTRDITAMMSSAWKWEKNMAEKAAAS